MCDDGFSDRAANVVCRSLGFTEGGQARRATIKGKGPIWLDAVRCLPPPRARVLDPAEVGSEKIDEV